MALVIFGKTRCGLCGRAIQADVALKSFSAFVTNAADPLSRFSDAAFHAECFRRHPLAVQCEHEYEKQRMEGAPGHRGCRICGLKIDNPDDYFVLGLLSSTIPELAAYNGWQAHKSCLQDWSGLDDLLQLLQSAVDNNQLQGPAVQRLIETLAEQSLKTVPEG